MSVDGRRIVLIGLFALAVLGVLASTAWAWFWAGFTLDTGPLQRRLHLDRAMAAALGAGLLALGALPMWLLCIPLWLTVVVAITVSILGVTSLAEVLAAAGAPARHSADDSWTVTLQQFCYAPTTWPMLLFVVVTPLVRVRSLLGRR